MTPREPSESRLAPGDVWRCGQGYSKVRVKGYMLAAMMSTYSHPVADPPKQPKKQKPKHEPHPLTLAQRKKILAKRIAARGKK
jgi:hypothetical protein